MYDHDDVLTFLKEITCKNCLTLRPHLRKMSNNEALILISKLIGGKENRGYY